MKVFTRNERDAREAVFVVNDALRDLHLNLQGSKTEVLSGDRLTKELDNGDLDKVEVIFKAVQKLDSDKAADAKAITSALKPLSPLATRFTRGLPDSVLGLSNKDHRLFRRLMTVYGWCGRTRLRNASLTALRELPDLRILRKSLSYLRQLPINTHDEAVSNILDIVESDSLPFPYQQALAFEALRDLHPKLPNKVASRIRQYLTKKRPWVVCQKGMEAIATFPYKAASAQTLAERFLKDDHPMVRRAALVLLVRSPKHHVRDRLQELIYHPDQSVTRLALYLHRFIADREFAKSELGRINHSDQTDLVFLRNLPRLYAIAATEDDMVAKHLLEAVGKMLKSKSVKVAWHRERLADLTKWSLSPTSTDIDI